MYLYQSKDNHVMNKRNKRSYKHIPIRLEQIEGLCSSKC